MRWTRWLAPIFLAVVALNAAGCSGAAKATAVQSPAPKNALAQDLYDASMSTDGDLLLLEMTLPNAIKQGDAAAIETAIHQADDLKRNWHKAAAGATGKLADAAGKYEESIALRIHMFEEASRTVLSHSVEASRAMVRFQTQAMDLAGEAQKAIKALQ